MSTSESAPLPHAADAPDGFYDYLVSGQVYGSLGNLNRVAAPQTPDPPSHQHVSQARKFSCSHCTRGMSLHRLPSPLPGPILTGAWRRSLPP